MIYLIIVSGILAAHVVYFATCAYMWRDASRKWEQASNGWRNLYYKVRYSTQPTHSPLYVQHPGTFVN